MKRIIIYVLFLMFLITSCCPLQTVKHSEVKSKKVLVKKNKHLNKKPEIYVVQTQKKNPYKYVKRNK